MASLFRWASYLSQPGGAQTQECPIPPAGRAWCDFLHRAELSIEPSWRRKSTPAIRGERAGNRVSADAVGRRGLFLEGRVSFRFQRCCPSGKCAERGRKSRPRRPGLENRDQDRYGVRKPRPSTETATESANRVRFGLALPLPLPLRNSRPHPQTKTAPLEWSPGGN